MILFFFFNDTATTEIYTLSLHDALPILITPAELEGLLTGIDAVRAELESGRFPFRRELGPDRKSTRLNSSHSSISYAVFCLKKKKKNKKDLIGDSGTTSRAAHGDSRSA